MLLIQCKRSEIISITDSNLVYNIPLGNRVDVNAKITIPTNAKLGDNYTVGLSFTTVTDPSQGLGFGSSIDKYFPVTIIEKSPETNKTSKLNTSQWIIYLIAGIIIIGIIILIIKNNKTKTPKANSSAKKSSKISSY